MLSFGKDSFAVPVLHRHQHLADLPTSPLLFSWETYAILLGTVILSSIILSKRDARSRSSLQDIPILGAPSGSWMSRCAAYIRWTTDGVEMIKEGYRSNPDAIYRVPTSQLFFIIPAKHIHTLQNAPREKLDATHAIVWYFLGKYTGVDFHLFGRPLWEAVRRLTSSIPNLIPALHCLSMRLLGRWFPEADDWTEIVPWTRVLHLVAVTNTRTFVGQKFCDNVVWLEATEQYAQNIAEGAGLLKLVPDMLKPMLALILPQLYRLRRIQKLVRAMIVPEIELRRQQQDRKQGTHHLDLLDMFEQVAPADQQRPEQIANRVLSLCFAGTHGPSNHIMNVLLDLAARWDEYAEELREELDSVLAEAGGLLSKKALDKLYKLESFMKESARLEPGSALSFYRKLLEPLQLATGEVLPASSMISVPAIATALSEGCFGDDAGNFDGLRFYRQRQAKEDRNSSSRPAAQDFLWTTPSLGFLNFGYGRYACPGRFYAGAQTKLIVACILHKYDLRLLPGEKRPQSLAFGDANIPDPATKLLYRSRQMAENRFERAVVGAL